MPDQSRTLKKTALYDLHVTEVAKMASFAGYHMPIQYSSGVKKEHLHTRAQAGLFDVSHMGQFTLAGPNAATDLEKLTPIDIVDLQEGRQRYALLTNNKGGILDDLMVTRLPAFNNTNLLYIVVNGACKDEDITHIKSNLSDDTVISVLDDWALLALQGPKAAIVLAHLAPEVSNMVFMDAKKLNIAGVECLISRSGYTGEDGFEISVPNEQAFTLAQQILAHPEVEMIGLGARDSLRLEAGLCLYGHDINQETTPIESDLAWTISKSRRSEGVRAGGFLGADVIFKQIEAKDIIKKRVGLIGSSKAPVRSGTELVNIKGEKIGEVTSGTFGPSIDTPVAMAYILKAYTALETEVYAIVRGNKIRMTVSKMPFIQQRYYRG
ncbi:MAG: glycine cleavage system aminomethyltransferase GcvT [Candidatus Endonucleobacter sp. (ex Gigantidas childressi)]|nr:glycine cleavage system aminomethyltransferase GcvT [Candidatus Endonucleobacter sp. (ex Gigantidas childressi)]